MDFSKASGLAVYLQITQKIIIDIQLGRLPPSTMMPGSRKLADSLNINRKTIVQAYDELVAQGWLSTESRRGTFVSAKLPSSHIAENLCTETVTYTPSAVTEAPSSQGNVIDFNDGIPDTRLIPFEVLSRAFRHALVISARANRLGYDDPKGILALRKAIAAMLNMERGLHVGVDHICMVRGSQMGIFLAARLLTRPNDCIVFERLTYPPAREAFKSCGANVLSVGQDEYGINVEELEQLCKQQTIRAVYVTPHHQFPTTVMMTAERRLKLLMLAEQYDFSIVEDDYDHEFHFLHHPVFPLASTDRAERVIYVGSLSKVLAPGLRIGYLVATAAFIERCAAEIMLIDRQGNSVTELAVTELMDAGEIKRHIRRTFKIYSERRATLEQLIHQELSSLVDFELPSGGLAFWLRLKKPITIDNLAERAFSQKVRILPGSLFTDDNEATQAIRLGFASLNKLELTEGIQRLKRVLSAP
ncbi:MocR-like pyridoxine biosynthesis transcription factor PdxR [Methylobacter psychrophilus]|uniref:MocR-like pyridoxine biosynthesis transcription factor PdxR n=1 Tax=Methylobacter psychrophilus TaxID=96941 RepID=UPI0021D4A63C|nr:PLP-dependent aminotransferase family protein [Methylobacter psychrophilus]